MVSSSSRPLRLSWLCMYPRAHIALGAALIGLSKPRFSLRPLLTNHHCYGAFRVGKTVTNGFRLRDLENLFILPPAAYVNSDDDANPTLKSVVLSQYAMEEILDFLTQPGAMPSSQLGSAVHHDGS